MQLNRWNRMYWTPKSFPMSFLYFAILFLVGFHSAVFSESKTTISIQVTISSPDYYSPWKTKQPAVVETLAHYLGNNQFLVLSDYLEFAVGIVSDSKLITDPESRFLIKKIDYDLGLGVIELVGRNPTLEKDFKKLEFSKALKIQKKYILKDMTDSETFLEKEIQGLQYAVDNYTRGEIDFPYIEFTTKEKIKSNGQLVFLENKVSGIVYQYTKQKLLGKLIPSFAIENFLKCQDDPCFAGRDFRARTILNPTLRAFYGLKQNKGGLIVYKIFGNSILKEGDILLEVDKYRLDTSGKIQLKEFGSVNYTFLFSNKLLKDLKPIQLKVLRNQEELVLNWKPIAFPFQNIQIPHGPSRNKRPSYTILAGLVITDLSESLLEEWGKNWRERADKKLLYYYDSYKYSKEKNKRFLVLTQILPTEETKGYHGTSLQLLESINGKPANSQEQLKQEIANLKEDGLLEIVLDSGAKLVFSRDTIEKANQSILNKYSISATQ